MRWDDDGPIVGAKPSLLERLVGSFSPMRGLKGFGIGLLLSPVLIAIKSFRAEEFHWEGVPIFMLIVAVVCGLWGLFTKKDIPL
ncbi:hypothetical protein [Erythrobacter sp.]|uniref:hypothetical protein n=1 Tax=Erythrobacter sp. TaxID=1042 RepID=UPI001425E356|nr:hypothetical protein [Erythrobacter sp.]QIQ85836.1 MAG: hypothetical protein G9473_03410 [Erythrobacter sp.]